MQRPEVILLFYKKLTIFCYYFCSEQVTSEQTISSFGSLYFDMVPVLLLVVLVAVAEVRDIASQICSSWTKVNLICRCVRHASLQEHSPVIPKWVGRLLRCRCNSSLLVLHPRQFHQLFLPGCLLRLHIERAIMSSNGAGQTSLRQSQAGRDLLWACNNNKGTSDTILVWHIATTILEARHPHHQQDDPLQQTLQVFFGNGGRSSSISEKKTAVTHLSCYCTYLVESCPELLPDDDAWSKDLYKKVKKDTNRALATGGGIAVSSLTPEAMYRPLMELLGATQNHEVLKGSAKLAKQLGELAGGEEMAWELLARFWLEIILYLALSDNLKGHLQATDRGGGGELITFLWALLTHIGIIDRPGDTAASAPATGV
ncbi:hypothetical protein VPH35_112815 [Triticum aestivum]